MEYSSAFVCLMGMGTVFFGLISLIVLTRLMSIVLHCVRPKQVEASAPVPVPPPAAGAVTPEVIAAVSAAAAENLGTDITGIRILSVKPL